jgi:hypothetical protein
MVGVGTVVGVGGTVVGVGGTAVGVGAVVGVGVAAGRPQPVSSKVRTMIVKNKFLFISFLLFNW